MAVSMPEKNKEERPVEKFLRLYRDIFENKDERGISK